MHTAQKNQRRSSCSKQLVMAHAMANAERIAQDTGFDTKTFVMHAQQAMQRHEMATEHCIA
eukprot:2851502-Amphidinium_carterae.1